MPRSATECEKLGFTARLPSGTGSKSVNLFLVGFRLVEKVACV